jgi:hypothetical protein
MTMDKNMSHSLLAIKGMAVLLALIFFGVTTSVTPSMAFYTIHHGHDKDSHSKVWCGVKCQAGQAIVAPPLDLIPTFHRTTSIDIRKSLSIFPIPLTIPPSRGPPVLP